MKSLEDLDTRVTDSSISSNAHDKIIMEFERRKKAKSFPIPTEDAKVKLFLRLLREPICLFGERNAERRDRLKDVILKKEEIPVDLLEIVSTDERKRKADDEGEFFVMGSVEFYEMRKWLVKYSLTQAKNRISKEVELKSVPIHEIRQKREGIYMNLQIGDDRPMGCCVFSRDSQTLATASWSGDIKLWNVPSCDNQTTLKGHKDRVCGLAYNPDASCNIDLASCGVDKLIKLWSTTKAEEDKLVCSLEGHAHRVSKVAFHPSGKYLGSVSYDTSWRLWDIEKESELMLQEGHSKEVYTLAFQTDGGIAATGGLDAVGRVWDLRTTHAIMTLQGHLSSIFALDFSANGYELASGGLDNSIKIWDLRTLKCIHTIPAHTNLISQLKYSNSTLLSASYDNTAKIWGSFNYKLCKVLTGHENKILGIDIDLNENWIATCGFDRTFKLWEVPNLE